MLINSLPYEFDNLCFIGDFPKSTVQAMATVKANNKILCNLNAGLDVDGVELKPFPVVGALSSAHEYRSANLKGFSSLKVPANIKQLMPGIVFDKQPLESRQLSELIEQLAIQEDSANLAVLNLNGAELEYLVEDDTLLNTFNCVIISCSSANIFDGSENSFNELIAHLKANGIAYSIFPAEVHPFSFVLVHRMPSWKAKDKMLLNVQDKLRVAEDSLTNTINSNQALEQYKLKTESLLSAKEQELHDKATELQALNKVVEEKDGQLANESEQRKQLENNLSEQQAEIEGLKEKVSAQNTNIESLEAKCEKLTQDLQWVEDERNKAKEELNQQNQSARIANKLNLKLQVDLDDLRAKYAEKEQNERELSQLIEELYVKLKQASEFYYELEKKYPELTDEQRD